jgi:hypothetical protein
MENENDCKNKTCILRYLQGLRQKVRGFLTKKGECKDRNGKVMFEYWKLIDILPVVLDHEKEGNVVHVFSYDREREAYERGRGAWRLELCCLECGDRMSFYFPHHFYELEKGERNPCGSPMQEMGAGATYANKYLWINLLGLTEEEVLEMNSFREERKEEMKVKPKSSLGHKKDLGEISQEEKERHFQKVHQEAKDYIDQLLDSDPIDLGKFKHWMFEIYSSSKTGYDKSRKDEEGYREEWSKAFKELLRIAKNAHVEFDKGEWFLEI